MAALIPSEYGGSGTIGTSAGGARAKAIIAYNPATGQVKSGQAAAPAGFSHWFDFSHSLLILAATTLLTASMGVIHAAQVAGLLYVWRNIVQVAVSYPAGVIADRLGHMPVLVAGYVLGALTAVFTALAFWFNIDSIILLGVIFFIAGLYVAVQEALESTITAEIVQTETLTISYGALGTVNGTAKFICAAYKPPFVKAAS